MADATPTPEEDTTISKAAVKKEGFPGRSQIGSKGPHVKKLQALLGVEQTGSFDDETRQALMKKQEDKKTKATGVFTPEVFDEVF